MKIEQLVASYKGKDAIDSTADIIKVLQERKHPEPDIKAIENEWDPRKHKIYDYSLRPDKIIEKDVNGEPVTAIEPVARIALAMQKLIVRRGASFLFGNNVVINASNLENDKQKELAFNSIKRILKDNKEKSHNKKLARTLFKCTEVAECWYPIVGEESSDRYGFPSEFKIRCQIFSPDRGDKLFPLFDDTGDMIAFSREYKKKEDAREITFFETYTAEEKVIWKMDATEWEEIDRVPNPIGKINIVYGRQDLPEWYDVQNIIERLEKLLSNYADTIDYHASPTIFVKGVLKGFAQKGEAGKILESEHNADAKYLSWDQAPDSVKLEIENNLRMIFSLTQTPDISFESVKGIGNITGIALKLLFLDAHLKVEDKKEIFDEFLTRRYNILKAYVGMMNKKIETSAKSLEMEPDIVPYMIADDQSLIEMLSTATGQKQILSRKSAIRILGLVDDAETEMKEIDSETLKGMDE